ncbi:hypothetical protein M8C21_032194, partial [Ambrosia artemisiifolia]
YLHSLADENPDLQKQIGCVKGVFQIFNRNHIVSRRRVFSHSLKGSDTGGLLLNNRTPQRESSVMGQRHLNVEKHRLSTESSKDSNASGSQSRQNLDLRDVVKDSMHREARGLSHNIVMEKDSNNWYHDEPRELSRSKSCQFRDRTPSSVCKDYPRFSYDGRETDSRTTKSKQMKDLPRLSLDSRERSIHTPSFVSIKPSNDSRNLKNNGGVNADKDLSQTRPSGVVAKLMGLETFPSLKSSGSNNKMTNFTRSSEPISPSRKFPDLRSMSRGSIEPAPWKQRDATRVIRSSMHSPVSSVYSDVDKRLKNLEFAESGKDLRALKHVLEAMQVVKARKDERQDHQNPPCVSSESDVSRGHESHIVIMKPAKLVKKGVTNNKTGKDLITESTRGDRRSRPSTPLKDSNKPRKHSTKQRSESQSPSGRKKPSNLHKVDDQNRETQISSEYSEESNNRQSSSSTPEKTTLHVKTDNATEKIVKDRYGATKEVQSNTTFSAVKFQTNHEKLKKVEDLVQKLKNLNSGHNEPHTDYIASLCENTNPNDRYISEIFLASGLLLRDLQSFKPHPSGHPINPELFLVLEHTKYSNLQHEKFHRKLIFDAVNESLVGKLSSVSGMIMQNPRKLLRELCLEIEQLQVHMKRATCGLENEDYGVGDDVNSILGEDVLKRSGNWTGFHGESSVIAIEVGRLILLDLVDEVVLSQACE